MFPQNNRVVGIDKVCVPSLQIRRDKAQSSFIYFTTLAKENSRPLQIQLRNKTTTNLEIKYICFHFKIYFFIRNNCTNGLQGVSPTHLLPKKIFLQ